MPASSLLIPMIPMTAAPTTRPTPRGGALAGDVADGTSLGVQMHADSLLDPVPGCRCMLMHGPDPIHMTSV